MKHFLMIALWAGFAGSILAQEIIVDDFNDGAANTNNLGGFTGSFGNNATCAESLSQGGMALTFSRADDANSFSGFFSLLGTVDLNNGGVNQFSFRVKGETVNGQAAGGQNFQIELTDAQGRRLITALTNVPGLEAGAQSGQWTDVNVPLSAMLATSGSFNASQVQQVAIVFNREFTAPNSSGMTSRIVIDDLKFSFRANPPASLMTPDPSNPDIDVISGWQQRSAGQTSREVFTVAEDASSLRGTAAKLYYDVSETGDDFAFISFRPPAPVNMSAIKTVKFRMRATSVDPVPVRLVLELKQNGVTRGTVLVNHRAGTSYSQTVFPIYLESSAIDEAVIAWGDGTKGKFLVDQFSFSTSPYVPNNPAYTPNAGPARSDAAFLDYVQARTAQYFVDQVIGSGYFVRDSANVASPSSIAGSGFGLSALTVIAKRYDPTVGSVWHITAPDGTAITPQVAQARANAMLDQLLAIQSLQPNTSTGQGDPQRLYGIAGFFYHFMNADGTRAWDSEVSVVDTSILLAGALQAGEYFGGSTKTKAEQLHSNVNWDFVYSSSAQQFHWGWLPQPGRGYVQPGPNGIGYLSGGLVDRPTDEALLIHLLALAKDPNRTAYKQAFFGYPRVQRTYASPGGQQFPVFNSYVGSGFTYLFANVWFPFQRIGPDRPELVNATLAYPTRINWWTNSVTAIKANRQFAIDRSQYFPFSFSDRSWGLSAVLRPDGVYEGLFGAAPTEYGPSHDGTVAPHMMFATMPFFRLSTNETLSSNLAFQAMRFGYDQRFNNLFGPYGPVDSFNDKAEFCNTTLAIDQGPITLAIENYRSSSVWDTFYKSAKVKGGINAVFGNPPVISPVPAQTVAAGQTLRLDVTATDANSDPGLALTAENMPAGATFTLLSQSAGQVRMRLTWKPKTTDVGAHVVTFRAKDQYREADSTVPVTITVTKR